MLDFIIIGGAQAGLSIAYHLKQKGKKFLIVDGEKEIGASWLNRWDSLRLFTPSQYNNLPGFRFEKEFGYYPNKNEVAQYFKDYVAHFNFPVQLNTLITKVKKVDGHFELTYDGGVLHAENVVVATGPFHIPFTPPCHTKLNNDIVQLHSNYYKDVSQLKQGDTLVVGAGDSGYQILDELSKDASRKVYFSGDTTVKSIPQEFLGKTLWWWLKLVGFLSFNKYGFIGRRIKNATQPIIGTDVKEILARENVRVVGRTLDANDDFLEFEMRRVKGIKNIVWATGYKPNFEWIDGVELDEDRYPKNYRGVSSTKGLYFIGLPWMYTRGSATLGGVAKDAKYLSDYIG